ncbi:MAG: phage holin family protein [Leifsonia sp.]
MSDMGRLLLRLLINAVALWLTTLILNPHVTVAPFAPGGTLEKILTYLIVAAIFGIVNGVIGSIVRIVALPIYILTLGLISLIVNGLLLLLVAWISGLIGFGLHVENFGWGILGALVLGILGWLIGVLLRPFTGAKK